jgi:hypothetical protein
MQSACWLSLRPTRSVKSPLTAAGPPRVQVQLGGDRVPARRAQAWQRRQSGKVGRLRVFREDSYMDPNQQLCLGATFDINATNVRKAHVVHPHNTLNNLVSLVASR